MSKDIKDTPFLFNSNIQSINIDEEMERSYLDYAMSVIISRALPDVRDGLKPVHRRIIFSMYKNGFYNNKPFRKSANIVGDVMGKYHPHGDSAIYDAMVRMTQTFLLRVPLISGQGNFGSMDGDKAAAMRYTEARLAKISEEMVLDIEKQVVDFKDNYDSSLQEPVVLPTKFPNLLVNGASGIAVGMATNIPPHNLGELIDACLHILNNPEHEESEVIAYVKGPDFPTGGRAIGRKSIADYLATGRGSFKISSISEIVQHQNNKSTIIIKEVPWQVNKSKLVEEISKLKDKGSIYNVDLDVISAVRDESDRHGVRIVIELKRDIDPNMVINYLQKYTNYQISFSSNMLSIHHNLPKLMGVYQMLQAFLEFRYNVVYKRILYLLNQARSKVHILVGLGIAVENIDEVIQIVRYSPSPSVAKEKLLERRWRVGQILQYIKLLNDEDYVIEEGDTYYLTETQVRAILDLRLHRLTGLEREKIIADLKALGEAILDYINILNSKEKVFKIINDELIEIKQKFATPRKTLVEDAQDDLAEEDFIQEHTVVVSISNSGYVKRVNLDNYRSQRRGGKGKSGMGTKDNDFVTDIFTLSTHDYLLFFTSKGSVYRIRCYKLPDSQANAMGRPIANLIPLGENEAISAVLPMPVQYDDINDKTLIFATQKGLVKRNKLSDFENISSNGKIAIKLDSEDNLIGVKISDHHHDILLTTKEGKSIRFPVEKLRIFASRNTSGVKGITIRGSDNVVNLSILDHEKLDTDIKNAYLKYSYAKRRNEAIDTNILSEEEIKPIVEREQYILTITSQGFGKITSAYEFNITNRGGSGYFNAKLVNKNGFIVSSFVVEETDDIIIADSSGKMIRCGVGNIRIASRVSIGVKVFNILPKEKVVSVSRIIKSEIEDSE